MSVKNRGLGRGLSSLLGDLEIGSVAVNEDKTITGEFNPALFDVPSQENLAKLRYLPLEKITRSPYQPRQEFEPGALEELANSIRMQGVIQPILVRPLGFEQYELIAGERRWRAAQLAQLETIPAIVRDINDSEAAVLALIENLQRENLNPIEEAMALNRLIDEFNMTHEQVAETVGRSRSSVSNLLRLLNLKEDVKRALQEGKLEMGHARAILSLPSEQQTLISSQIIAKQLSVRETEKIVRDMQQPQIKAKPIFTKSIDPNIKHLQEELSIRLKTKVKIEHKSDGSGQLIIHYHSVDELQGVLDSLV